MIDAIDLDHVALAAERQRDLWQRYAGDLAGAWLAGDEDWGDAELPYDIGFRAAQVQYANGMKVEMLEPFRPERNDFLRRFLDRSGPGPHHLTFKVRDIRAALDEAERAGYQAVGVNLAHEGWKEAFLHPKQACGVVVQIAQSGGNGEWTSSPPTDLPAPRTPQPASLDHVTHAVASLDDGLTLFAGLLAGREVSNGKDDTTRWVDLAWPGPGRVRLVEPAAPTSPIAEWLGDRPGRIHHLRFTSAEPQNVADAAPRENGAYEVPPEKNLGTRLLLDAS